MARYGFETMMHEAFAFACLRVAWRLRVCVSSFLAFACFACLRVGWFLAANLMLFAAVVLPVMLSVARVVVQPMAPAAYASQAAEVILGSHWRLSSSWQPPLARRLSESAFARESSSKPWWILRPGLQDPPWILKSGGHT